MCVFNSLAPPNSAKTLSVFEDQLDTTHVDLAPLHPSASICLMMSQVECEASLRLFIFFDSTLRAQRVHIRRLCALATRPSSEMGETPCAPVQPCAPVICAAAACRIAQLAN